MKSLIAALLLAAAYASESGSARLFVQVSPGLEVLVDGVSAGLSSAEEGGRIVPNLAPGAHHVVVRASDGREGSFHVTLIAGETRSISVSPLGLRRKLTTSAGNDTASLRIMSIPDDSTVEFRGSVQQKRGTDALAFDAIPAGKYPLAVTRGAKTLRTDVDLASGTIVTVRADFTSGTIRTIDTRRRPHRLEVAEANDALTTLAVPPQWKTAIRGALPSGVVIASAALADGNAVKVTLHVPSADVGESLIESLETSRSFSRITIPAAPRRERIGWVVDFTFYFPAGR